MKKLILFIFAAATIIAADAQEVKIKNFRHAGPFGLQSPVLIDSINYSSQKYDTLSLLNANINLDIAKEATQIVDSILPVNNGSSPALNLLYASFSNTSFTKAKINVSKINNYKLFVDGKEQSSGKELELSPRTHDIMIKYLAMPGKADTALVNLTQTPSNSMTPSNSPIGGESLADGSSHLVVSTPLLVEGPGEVGGSLYYAEAGVKAKSSLYIRPSDDGLYYIQIDHQRFPDNSDAWTYILKETKGNRVLLTSKQAINWAPNCDHSFYKYENSKLGKKLILVDAKTMQETVLCTNMPKDQATILPNLKQAIISKSNEGPKADDDKHLYLHPEDRVPGWRDRGSLELFNFETCLSTPITYGNRSASLLDVSADSRYLILSVNTDEIEAMRPTAFFSVLRLDLQTMKTDTIIAKDGFFADATISPDGKTLAVKASPEFADRIGCTLPADKYPNIYDYQLYLIEIEKAIGKQSDAITPVTKDFNPSIEDVKWSAFDNNIYFNALDKDLIKLYQLDPKAAKIKHIAVPSDCVARFYLADKSPLIGVGCQSINAYEKTYWVNCKTLKATLLEDVHKRELGEYAMPECREFNFTNSEGYEITGCYLLPPGFDEQKAEKGKYPMLVYYYGGCSPVSRYFSTSYSFPALASQGYIVYILQPRGCAGFGQEFGSWHCNTAGDPQTKDIIEGTKAFIAAHPYVNEKKLGAFGASYGGFMTMHLQTKTDMFAAAWSHAGISNHTSYWGFGYWGYTYSQVSMPGTYPWTNKELYVDRSPLFNADKIKTPILFTHGTNDRNVPPIESSQMFTALRLLGKQTAYVTFQQEEHHVQNYNRLMNWQNTFMAWFAKWLKDDSSWWDSIYPKVNL